MELPLSLNKLRSLSPRIKFILFSYMLLLPALLVQLSIYLYPLFQTIFLSFHYKSLFYPWKGTPFVGLGNYVDLFQTSLFWFALKNTFLWVAISVLFITFLGVGAALLLNHEILTKLRIRAIARGLILIPWILPVIVATVAWKWMYQPTFGLVNQVMMNLGIIHEPIEFLSNPKWIWASIIVAKVWRDFPFVTITTLAALQAIPQVILESATVDGAGPFARFTHITFPLLRPVIMVVIFLELIWTWNNFVWIYMLTRGGPGDFTQILAILVYIQAFEDYNVGYASSIAMVMIGITVVLGLIYLRFYTKKWMES